MRTPTRLKITIPPRSAWRLGAATASVASISLLAPSAAHASLARPQATESVPTIGFLTPEQYAQRWGHSAPNTISTTPKTFRTQSGAIVNTAVPNDPPGGSDAHWWTILWDFHDLRGTGTPVRLGDDHLGYYHYSQPHNIYASAPIHAAFQTHKPDVQQGAHLEYRALATDPSNGNVYAVVRVVVQAATSTDDRQYKAPDGKNIGVITAYCEGTNVCPDWINNIPG